MFKPTLCAALGVLLATTAAHAQLDSAQSASQGTLFYQFYNRENGLINTTPGRGFNSQIVRTSSDGGPQLVGLDCYGVTFDPKTKQMCFVRSHIVSDKGIKGDYSAFYLCNLDGTNARLLQRERIDYSSTVGMVSDFMPFYASNGDILFETGDRIARMNGDGSNVRFLTGAAEHCGMPSEGNGVIAFEKNGVCVCDVSGRKRRHVSYFGTKYGSIGGAYTDAKVSPDGKQVVFLREQQVYVASTDETNTLGQWVSQTSLNLQFSDPVWSPDGRFIAAAGVPLGGGAHDIYLIDVSGGKMRQITHTPEDELPCDWRLTA